MLSEGGQGVLFPLRSRRVASKTLPAGPPEAILGWGFIVEAGRNFRMRKAGRGVRFGVLRGGLEAPKSFT